MFYELNQDFVPDFAGYDDYDPEQQMYNMSMGQIRNLFVPRGMPEPTSRPSPWASTKRTVRRGSPKIHSVWGSPKKTVRSRLTKISAERIYGETPEGIIYLPSTGVLTLIPNSYIRGKNMRGDIIVQNP